LSTNSEIGLPLPILFTCPHGSEVPMDSWFIRLEKNYPTSCVCCEKFETDSDRHTIELTNSIAGKIRILSERNVHTNIAQYDRLYIDYNRDVECAIEPSNDKSAEREYHSYHKDTLRQIKEMRTQNPDGLSFLFDIHGTGLKKIRDSNGVLQPIDIIIGTDEERSIHALTELHPNVWWNNDTGLIGLLKKKEIKVWPPNPDEELKSTKLDGGYTIKTFGSSQFNEGLVAIQCEVTPALREEDQREQFAAVMAECIWNFVSPLL
jgi:hypothetical protein